MPETPEDAHDIALHRSEKAYEAHCICGWAALGLPDVRAALDAADDHIRQLPAARRPPKQLHELSFRFVDELHYADCSCGWASLPWDERGHAEWAGDIHRRSIRP